MPTDPLRQTTRKQRTIYGWCCAVLATLALLAAGPQAQIPLWSALALFAAVKILEPVDVR